MPRPTPQHLVLILATHPVISRERTRNKNFLTKQKKDSRSPLRTHYWPLRCNTANTARGACVGEKWGSDSYREKRVVYGG